MCTWDVSRLTSLANAFNGYRGPLFDISQWDISGIGNLDLTFSNSTYNWNVSSWDVGMVTSMDFCFANSENFNQDLSSWDVGNVQSMAFMFAGASSFNQDLSMWDVSSVTDISAAFVMAISFNQDLCEWNDHLVRQSLFLKTRPSVFSSTACPYGDINSPCACGHYEHLCHYCPGHNCPAESPTLKPTLSAQEMHDNAMDIIGNIRVKKTGQ